MSQLPELINQFTAGNVEVATVVLTPYMWILSVLVRTGGRDQD